MSDSTLVVDLDAIARNYTYLNKKSGKSECAAVVKANAYGLGVTPVGKAIAAAGCNRFFVATLDEGIILRKTLPDHDIYILNGFLPGQEADCDAYGLIPVLNDRLRIDLWSQYAKDKEKSLPAIIHIDTGMCRFGLSEAETEDLFRHQKDALKPLKLHYVMTHLACGNDPEHYLNARQLHRFKRIQETIGAIPLSIANSSGIFLGDTYHYDLVRPGSALYGVHPQKEPLPNPMEHVITVKAKILQLRQTTKDETVGYGATCEVKKGSVIATLSLGYADGYCRSLGNKAYGFIVGKRVSVVGRVSMDLVMIDVTNVPEAERFVGAEVEMIGSHYTIDDMAEDANTIGYEVLTRLGNRYHREYKGTGQNEYSR